MGLLTPLYISEIGENRFLIMTKNIDIFLKLQNPAASFLLCYSPQKSQANSTKIAINFKKYFASWSTFKLHSDVIAVPKRKPLRARPALRLGRARPRCPSASVARLVLVMPPVKVVVEENYAS